MLNFDYGGRFGVVIILIRIIKSLMGGRGWGGRGCGRTGLTRGGGSGFRFLEKGGGGFRNAGLSGVRHGNGSGADLERDVMLYGPKGSRTDR